MKLNSNYSIQTNIESYLPKETAKLKKEQEKTIAAHENNEKGSIKTRAMIRN